MKKCKTCKWHDDFSWACCNGDSDECADFTDNDYVCSHWEAAESNEKRLAYENETDQVLKIVQRVAEVEAEPVKVEAEPVKMDEKSDYVIFAKVATTFSFIAGCFLALTVMHCVFREFAMAARVSMLFVAFFVCTIICETTALKQ